MPLDFPNSPTNGQIFSSGGMLWRFDGTKWVAASGVLALPDAPSDGNTYGRSNATWSSVNALLATPANVALNDTGRNLIHNGQMNISQRTGPFTASGAYTLDRWKIGLGGSDTVSISQQPLADADRAAIGDEAAENTLQMVFTGTAGASSYNALLQFVEDVRRLGGKTATLSFWARATSGTPRIGVTFQQNFGTGGSPSAGTTVSLPLTAALSATWTRYALTGTFPSTSGKTLGTNGNSASQITWWVSDGAAFSGTGVGVQSGTIQLWGVQLEIGSIATPLAKRDPTFEMQLCQRFYQTGTGPSLQGYTVSGVGVGVTVFWPVPFRAAPTITNTWSNVGSIQSPTFTANASSAFVGATGNASGGFILNANSFTASADL